MFLYNIYYSKNIAIYYPSIRLMKKVINSLNWKIFNINSRKKKSKIKGKILKVNNNQIIGWAVELDKDEPVEVELRVDDFTINKTYATQKYKDRNIAFRFPMTQVWNHLRKGQILSVHVKNSKLKFPDGNSEFEVNQDGAKCSKNILDKISSGYVINKKGIIQKHWDTNMKWTERILPEYEKINESMKREFGKSLFVFYGTLLGFAREGDIMVHDTDLDLAYLSNETNPEKITEEFYVISKYFIKTNQVTVPFTYKIQLPGRGISITPCWFTDTVFYSTFGFVGDGFEVKLSDIIPFKKVMLKGYEVLEPNNKIKVAQYLYGVGWKYPDPGWKWKPEYKSRPITQKARLTDYQVEVLKELKCSLK